MQKARLLMTAPKLTIFDLLPILKVFESRMTGKKKYKKMMSGLRLSRKLKAHDGRLEMITQ